MIIQNTNWNFPTSIWFGPGRIKELVKACEHLGIQNPLFVTDEVLINLDIVKSTTELLRSGGIKFNMYSNVQGNPTGSNVTEGVDFYNVNEHDGVIAFGGGSALDAAKTIALMSGQARSIWDFEDVGDNWSRADVNSIAPIIAIPTTAGTGSEVGRAAVILDEEACSKKIIFHPKMLPSLIISDPELTLGLPSNITAWTGMDALVHAMEAYCAPGYHPMADGIAIEAIRMITKNLPIAVADGQNLEARGQMLTASSMAAVAFQKGLGSIHSVAHQLGAIYNIQHGLVNSILLPYGLKQNTLAIEERMVHLSIVLGLDTPGTSTIINYILDLRNQLNIPHSLKEVDITSDRAKEVGEKAFKDPSTPTNAKPVNARDLENLFMAAFEGKLENL
ncbi:iron-containing alcohol dehydrogenase [Fulvivirgaceae bacterium BMA10]|uniref:Iron-containing alcohol dehydrogenase n=1 Tax=Splendidivirga corallicola TaxID=3051826 RepID=A0ABT8KV78_9BACT|nr:iron-containing alcohol dehydrogenase [Fulvivirgaceae bacterium BMA10]